MEEMKKLRNWLKEKGIKFLTVYYPEEDEYKISRTIFDHQGVHWSVIHGDGTMGGIDFNDVDNGLLEAWPQNIDSDPTGYLTAEELEELVLKYKKED